MNQKSNINISFIILLYEWFIMNLFLSYFLWGFNYGSTEIRKEKEELVYPAVSFVAEFGGSLGLFVGFSFLTIWDCIDYLASRSKSVKDHFI